MLKKNHTDITKKGFTLVELLAVIIILGIIALITFPIVDKSIENSKQAALERSIDSILEAAHNYSTQNSLGYSTEENVIFLNELKSSGFLEIETINPVTNKEMTGCVLYKWDEINNQYVFRYDEECKNHTPVSFKDDSWKTIANAVKNGDMSKYKVGDTKEVTLTGEYAGTYTVRIANITTPSECSNNEFSQTACGFVIEFVDIITLRKINSTLTNIGGYPASELYIFLKNDIYNSLPEDLKNVIIDTKVISSHGSGDLENFITNDKLYLLATKEIYGKNGTSNIISNDTSDNNTRQLDYYEMNNVSTSNYKGAIKRHQELESYWWTRSAFAHLNTAFYRIMLDGNWNDPHAIDINGVAPAFRIG